MEFNLSNTTIKALQSIARRYAQDGMEADDLFSEITEGVLTSCKPDDSQARIVTKARWIALSHLRTNRVYSKYVGSQYDLECNLSKSDDGEQYEVDELFMADELSPEDQLTEMELAAALEVAISQLSPTDQKIARMLRDGLQPVDIAKALDVSRSAISQRINKLAVSLSGFAMA